MEELIRMLQSICPMSPALEVHLRSIIRLRLFRRGDLLLQVGEVARDILYLQRGLVRSYYLVRDVEEVSNWFMKEGDICISILSFFRQCPSVDSIVALEDCECWGITHAELEELYRLFPEFNLHGRLIASEYYCRSEERHQAIRRQSPVDKYARLMEADPDLVRRVKNKDLASFLNVGNRTFNMIRKEYLEKMRREWLRAGRLK